MSGPAIKVGGYCAKACIRVTNLKDRTAGLGDAVMIVDGDNMDTWPDADLIAILDHELTHLELKIDKDGAVCLDDAGRPKLRMRKHDQQYGWFNDIAKKHGPAATEVQQMQVAGAYAVREGWLNGF